MWEDASAPVRPAARGTTPVGTDGATDQADLAAFLLHVPSPHPGAGCHSVPTQSVLFATSMSQRSWAGFRIACERLWQVLAQARARLPGRLEAMPDKAQLFGGDRSFVLEKALVTVP